MKKISMLLIGVFSAATIFAQADIFPVDENTGKITYMSVEEASDMSASELFKVLQSIANENGFQKVSGEGTEAEYKAKLTVFYPKPGGGNDEGIITYTAHLMAKDGRYRYIFTDFSHSARGCEGGDLLPTKLPCSESRMSKPGWFRIRKETHENMTKIIDDLKQKVIEAAADPAKNDDW